MNKEMIGEFYEFDITNYDFKFIHANEAEKFLEEQYKTSFVQESCYVREDIIDDEKHLTFINFLIKDKKAYIVVRNYKEKINE